MGVNRREFMACTAAVATVAAREALAGSRAVAAPPDFAAMRTEFPWASTETYLDAAALHPVSRSAAQAVERYLARHVQGPGPGRSDVTEEELGQVKALYAGLINARPSEIAFIQSTLSGENIVAAGLGLDRARGNIVTDELHFHGGLYLYESLRDAGLEVRVVKQRDWMIDPADMAAAIDHDTRLVAITLVSNVNGYLHDARHVSELAHAHGAYLYADIIQAVGCIPVDVRALGIDFAAASTYKWLMGLKGLGYLYVREDLQGDVLRTSRFGPRQYSGIQYHNFPGSPPGAGPRSWDPRPGAARYEVGNLSNIAVACQLESLRRIKEMGVENIWAHAKPLVERLRTEIPPLGYPCITPAGTPAPLATFLAPDPEPLKARLAKANVKVKVLWNQMRVSPSIYNDDRDIDRLLDALA